MSKHTEIIAKIAQMPTDGRAITQAQGEEIARLFGGDFAAFNELDEKPGRWGYEVNPETGFYARAGEGAEWHWKLRQARNGCHNFFAILSGKAPERSPGDWGPLDGPHLATPRED